MYAVSYMWNIKNNNKNWTNKNKLKDTDNRLVIAREEHESGRMGELIFFFSLNKFNIF